MRLPRSGDRAKRRTSILRDLRSGHGAYAARNLHAYVERLPRRRHDTVEDELTNLQVQDQL